MVKGSETTYFMTATTEAYIEANSDLLTLLLIYADTLTRTITGGRQGTTADELRLAIRAGATENRADPEWAQHGENQELVAAQLDDLLVQAVAQGLLAAAQD